MSQELPKTKVPGSDRIGLELPPEVEEISNDLRVFTRAALELERVLSSAVGTKQIAKLRTPAEVLHGTVEKVTDGWVKLATSEGRVPVEHNVRIDTVQAYVLSPPA